MAARLVDLVLAFGLAGGYFATVEVLVGADSALTMAAWLIPPAYEIAGVLSGGTPGKRAFGVGVVDVRAPWGRLAPITAVLRGLAVHLLLLVWVVNLLVLLVDRASGRAIHDSLAHTMVVRTRGAGAHTVTPAPSAPAPPPGTPLAGPGRRVAARCVDLLVGAVLAALATSALNSLTAGAWPGGGVPDGLLLAFLAACLLPGLGYELVCALFGGTTLGKALFGLRVALWRTPARPVPASRLALRAGAFWGLAAVPGLAGAACDLAVFLRDRSRRCALHDLGVTTVVDVRAASRG